MENKMKDYLPKMEPAKMQALFEIRNAYKAGELSVEEARDRIRQRVGTVSAYHIAYLEQTMTEETEDECLREDIHSLIHLLDGFMDYSRPNLPANHPITHYLNENDEMRKLLLAVEDLVQYPMIKNQSISVAL